MVDPASVQNAGPSRIKGRTIRIPSAYDETSTSWFGPVRQMPARKSAAKPTPEELAEQLQMPLEKVPQR